MNKNQTKLSIRNFEWTVYSMIRRKRNVKECDGGVDFGVDYGGGALGGDCTDTADIAPFPMLLGGSPRTSQKKNKKANLPFKQLVQSKLDQLSNKKK